MTRLLQHFSLHKWPFLLAFVAIFVSTMYTTLTPFHQPALPDDRVWVTGQVERVRLTDTRARLVLRHVVLYGVETPIDQLAHLKISVARTRWEKLGLHTGDGLAAQVKIFPIPHAEFPGDYDPTRFAALQDIGATGYVMGEIRGTYLDLPRQFMDTIHTGRRQLADYVSQVASPLAASLLTGVRDNLSQDVQNYFRHSGLAHLLAISGLHLGMLAGMIFFGLRYLFACMPSLALRYSTKKIAAIAALLAGAGYMLLAGATIPTVRAFIMLSFIFAAVLLGRPHISLRLWAFAVILVLFLWPYSVVTASFQMSFAATFVLILWASMRSPEQHFWGSLNYITGIFVTSFLAGFATMPLAAAHFGSVSFSGFLLNLIAIPLMGFWILPCGFLALILIPLGLDTPVFWLMQQGLNLLTFLAWWGAEGGLGQFLGGWRVPREAWPVLLFISLIAIASILFHKRLLALFSVCCAACICALWPVRAPADIILLDGGDTVLLCPEGKACSVVQALDGDRTWTRFLRTYHLEPTSLPSRCDGQGCTFSLHDQTVLVTQTPVSEDCRWADVIITSTPFEACPTVRVPSGERSLFFHLKK